MFAFRDPRPRRRPGLTAMIDVVFLLLVFFILAARFGPDTALPLTLAGGGDTGWLGPPRLISVAPGAVRLNGVIVAPGALAARLRPLMPAADAPVLLRAGAGTDLGRLALVIENLRSAGLTRLIVVE